MNIRREQDTAASVKTQKIKKLECHNIPPRVDKFVTAATKTEFKYLNTRGSEVNFLLRQRILHFLMHRIFIWQVY